MQYSQKVLDHFMHPHNVGKMENPDASATEGSPSCGDQVTVFLFETDCLIDLIIFSKKERRFIWIKKK